MNRKQYIRKLTSKLARLSEDEINDAITYYHEIFDEQGIGEEDKIPEAMVSPTKASYEILRDLSIYKLKENESRPPRYSLIEILAVIMAIIFSILAQPFGLLFTVIFFLILVIIILLCSSFLLLLVVGGVGGAFLSIYELIFVLPSNFEFSRMLYLNGALLISICIILAMIISFRFLIDFAKSKLIKENKVEKTNYLKYVKYLCLSLIIGGGLIGMAKFFGLESYTIGDVFANVGGSGFVNIL